MISSGMKTQNNIDAAMMRRCIELAQSVEGRTAPNPMVAAVVLDSKGNFVSEGFHPKAGLAHAEVFALDKAGERARGGTLYVSLEPCCHFGKRTPPCTERVIASGVSRVVVGMQDPNPQVSGNGIAKLQEAGILVELSSLENECRELNRAFVKRMRTGLPWLSLKMASTLDGHIADRNGNSRWISGNESRSYVHQLRNTHDCVLIGGSTAVKDDPELNVRELENGRDPHRAVIDPTLQVSPKARLCLHSADSSSWTVIFSSPEKVKNAAQYPERVKLVEATASEGSTVLQTALRWLAGNGVQSVLCEGGGRLAAALLEERLVDEIYWIIAPKLFVDSSAIPALAGTRFMPVTSCLEFSDLSYSQLGRDMLVRGQLKPKNVVE